MEYSQHDYADRIKRLSSKKTYQYTETKENYRLCKSIYSVKQYIHSMYSLMMNSVNTLAKILILPLDFNPEIITMFTTFHINLIKLDN